MSTDKKLVINDHLHGVVFKNDILTTLKKIGGVSASETKHNVISESKIGEFDLLVN